MTSFSTLSMYALTVQPPSATQQAIVGDFSGAGRQQILTANGSRLTILEVSRTSRGFKEIYTHDVFGIIQGIATFRLAGASKDFIIVASDSGRIVTLEYLPEEKRYKHIHFETYGKSGVRRVIPGQYLASDPKGRAMMIASVEKNKLVYILNRNTAGELTISSPLEAHKAKTLVYSVCALDVGYENPLFATLEVDYSESEDDPTGQAYEEIEKELVFYELDLGLNHVVRKASQKADRTANILFRVPGGTHGPSGVLCCGEDSIAYQHIDNPSHILRLPIPRRGGITDDPSRKRYIVAGTMYSLKGGGFLFLLQSEDGDIFKVTFDMADAKTGKGAVDRIRIKYFDTVPISSSICLLKSGFLYCACESGDRILYELEGLGEDDDETVFDSDQSVESYGDLPPAYFHPRPLRNITPVELIPSMNPLMDMQVANITGEDAPQIYTLVGSGARSTFRTSKHGLEVVDLIESELPSEAMMVWTTKRTVHDEHDAYIVLSLISKTLVLNIGEDVEEVQDSGYLKETTTLGTQQFGEDCLIQIHPKGIRHIDGNGSISDWQTPVHRTILACATNNRQVAIALSSGVVYYFECDVDGSLAKSDDEFPVDSAVTCLALGEVPEGRVRSNFLAVGCNDATVRIVSLQPDHNGELLKQQSVQALSAPPSGLCIMEMSDRTSHGSSLYLHIGLSSGVYIRTAMDDFTGELSETRRRFLGTKPIKFAQVKVGDEAAILAITSRPWLGYTDPNTKSLSISPLIYDAFESAFSFNSASFQGIICIRDRDLRIFTLSNLSSNLHQEAIPLQYTARKFVAHPDQPFFYVIESDNDTLDSDTRKMLEDHAKKQNQNGDAKMADGDGEAVNGEEGPPELPPADFGYSRAPGRWASCIQVVDPVDEKQVIQTIELEKNRAAVSIAVVTFDSREDEVFLAVGIAKNLTMAPTLSYKNGRVNLYRILDGGRTLEFVHKTRMDHPPMAMVGFKGKLAVGSGTELRLYDCGMRALLQKARAVGCTALRITGIKTQGSRLVVSDQRESVTYVVHKDQTHPNRLLPFADDTVSRWTTCTEMLDYESTVGGDKFGNLWIVRCPAEISQESDEPGDGGHLLAEKGYLGGTANRLKLMMHYYVQDIPTAIQKTSLITGGAKVVAWSGLQGTIGVLIPFESRKDFKMFQQLELIMRNEDKPLAGRDHLAYRSYYTPVKGVIDGDLIERFLVIHRDKREMIAAQLEGNWTVASVEGKIWNMRGLYAF